MTVMTREEALAELKKVATQLNTLFSTGCSVQDQLGLAYHSALSRNLAERAGYKNAWEYLSRNVKGLTRATLNTYTDAATYWGSAVTRKYGVERLKLLSRYLRANPPGIGQWPDPDPGFLSIRVPQPEGTVVVKTFADCSLEEMRRAVSPPRPKPVWEHVRIRERLRWLFLRQLIPQRFATTEVRVRAEGDKAFVTFQEVPVAELEKLIAVLQECLALERSSLQARP
ncbi:hypothetical protein ACN28I_17795 [Archangium gephyra]|uniref:hypothetical protein n=1 Tax=Archangium gephyra TaxID=48 RepID=UPI003B819CED